MQAQGQPGHSMACLKKKKKKKREINPHNNKINEMK